MSSIREQIALSIVIAAWNGKSAVERCVRSLNGDAERADTELIVVTNFEDGTGEMLARCFPYIQHIAMPSGTPVPRLRSTGIRASIGAIVALAEDHCDFAANWCAELVTAHRSEYGVIGGAVENAAKGSALDWAVYLYDYGRFAPRGVSRVVPALTGVNVSYKKEVLRLVDPALEGGLIEPFIHAQMMQHGFLLYFVPSVRVVHRKQYRGLDALSHCYHLARGYAAQRALGISRSKRWVLAAGSPLLPFILIGRIAGAGASSLSKFLRALPWLFCLMTSWSLGEFSGYSAGSGQSAGKWS